MPPPQRKKPSQNSWFKCEICNTYLVHKDVDLHKLNNCPPSVENPSHSFILNNILQGTLDLKSNEEIKGLSTQEKNNLVFLSQAAIQLCSFSIGDYVMVTPFDKIPYARIVWPTTEKSLTSVLFTQNALDLMRQQINQNVRVSKLPYSIYEALEITVTLQNAPKPLEISTELCMRLQKMHKTFLCTVGNNLSIMYYGKLLIFEIKSIIKSDIINSNINSNPRNLEEEFLDLTIEDSDTIQFYSIGDSTKFKIFDCEDTYNQNVGQRENVLVNNIGGSESEVDELTNIMQIALGRTPCITGIKPIRGVLLYGSSGTGKSMILDYIGCLSKANIFKMSGSNLHGKQTGEVESFFKNSLSEAMDKTPSVILLDELDILCPTRSSRVTDLEKRISGILLNFLNSLHQHKKKKVFVIGATNKLESVDVSFRRCGRFDREIEIPVPSPRSRLQILQKILENTQHPLSETQLKDVANKCHGYVGSDLAFLCSRAALNASKSGKNRLEVEDFDYAFTRVVPSAMRQVQIEVPTVKWSDIGGQENLKLILKQSVEWPLKHPESFVRLGVTPPRGVLMFGPPGCSKTMIAKALATESGLNFISIKGPELFSKWVGESEKAVREVFQKARQVAPSIIFFDEIDALGGERSSSASSTNVQERVLAQLLTELDGVTPLGDVTVVAATNRPDRIDRALLRPGRLDRIVYVPLPDCHTRFEIFRLKLSKMPVEGDVDVHELVRLTEGYSGAEANAVCHEAAMKALEESLEATTVTMTHFEMALRMIQPRTSSSLLNIYEEYVKQKV